MDLDTLLNKNQKEAATYLDSHLRIIAGAGSGKTRVVTYRIAHLIQDVGIDPRSILAITFTNKAANEMKERVNEVVGIHGSGTLICTIHSLCVRFLRQHINVLNYPSNFTIMDEEDQKALIKKLYTQLEIDAKVISIKSMINTISSYKTARVSPQRAIELAGQFSGELKKAKVYEAYENYKEDHFLLDFDDLLLKAVYILDNYPDILEKWQRKFQYIHVDEFQDVGEIEYHLVQLLSKYAIVCVVGDPDQTIYSFRGADVHFILDFDKDFKPNKTIILDQNYRSTGNILKVSNNLIFGAEYDFFEREDGYKELQKVYNMNFKKQIDMDIGLKYQAMKDKKIDVMVIFTTDGQLAISDVVVLEDDKKMYPSYRAGTVIRSEILSEYPELKPVLEKLNSILDDKTMADLNYQVESEGKKPEDVAREYLQEKGLLEAR